MKKDGQEKLKISNELLDSMLVDVKTQEDLWGKDGIITQLNKALLERILRVSLKMVLLSAFEKETRIFFPHVLKVPFII